MAADATWLKGYWQQPPFSHWLLVRCTQKTSETRSEQNCLHLFILQEKRVRWGEVCVSHIIQSHIEEAESLFVECVCWCWFCWNDASPPICLSLVNSISINAQGDTGGRRGWKGKRWAMIGAWMREWFMYGLKVVSEVFKRNDPS